MCARPMAYGRRNVPPPGGRGGLFHGHALGQVARLVNVAAAAVGDLVGEQLGRDGVENGVEILMDLGQKKHVLGKRVQVAVALGAEQHQPPLAGLDLLHVGHGFQVDAVPRYQAHHRHVPVDEGDRAVLEFAGGIALGVDVGDLLELERAFQSDGEVEAAAHEEEVAGVVVAFDQPGDPGLQARQFGLDDRGQVGP